MGWALGCVGIMVKRLLLICKKALKDLNPDGETPLGRSRQSNPEFAHLCEYQGRYEHRFPITADVLDEINSGQSCFCGKIKYHRRKNGHPKTEEYHVTSLLVFAMERSIMVP